MNIFIEDANNPGGRVALPGNEPDSVLHTSFTSNRNSRSQDGENARSGARSDARSGPSQSPVYPAGHSPRASHQLPIMFQQPGGRVQYQPRIPTAGHQVPIVSQQPGGRVQHQQPLAAGQQPHGRVHFHPPAASQQALVTHPFTHQQHQQPPQLVQYQHNLPQQVPPPNSFSTFNTTQANNHHPNTGQAIHVGGNHSRPNQQQVGGFASFGVAQARARQPTLQHPRQQYQLHRQRLASQQRLASRQRLALQQRLASQPPVVTEIDLAIRRLRMTVQQPANVPPPIQDPPAQSGSELDLQSAIQQLSIHQSIDRFQSEFQVHLPNNQQAGPESSVQQSQAEQQFEFQLELASNSEDRAESLRIQDS